jgi:RNA polymerase sigma-B factor
MDPPPGARAWTDPGVQPGSPAAPLVNTRIVCFPEVTRFGKWAGCIPQTGTPVTTSAVGPLSPLPDPDSDSERDRDARDRRTAQLLREAATAAVPARRRQLLDEVVIVNRELALAIAHRYRNRGVEDEDLEQVALLALIKAVRRFRLDAGRPFAAFAAPTIAGEVKRHFRDHAWVVRPPRSVQELSLSVRTSQTTLTQALGREPTPSEIADELGVDDQDVRSGIKARQSFVPLSLDQPAPDGTVTMGDMLPHPCDDMERVEAVASVRAVVAGLPPADRRLLRLRFIEERTQADIGAQLGISQMQVSRRLSALLADLRRRLEDVEGWGEGDPVSA